MPFKNIEDKLRWNKQWREKNAAHFKQYMKQYNRKRDARIKLTVMLHYGGSPPRCACCGEEHIEFLTIDHINGRGNTHKKRLGLTGRGFYEWLIKNKFPTGFRVLCYNCNLSVGHLGYCPHERGKPKELTFISTVS